LKQIKKGISNKFNMKNAFKRMFMVTINLGIYLKKTENILTREKEQGKKAKLLNIKKNSCNTLKKNLNSE
jgi:hypothetical protein